MKVCFVGIGSIGKRHLKNLKSVCDKRVIDVQIDVLRSSQRPLEQEILELITHEFYDIAALDAEYDMIFITNPTHLHYETIGDLKNHSKYFFVEKPIFSSGEEDIVALDLPKENVYYVACPLRYTSVLQEAKKFVKEHEVFSAKAISSSYLPDWRPGVDYRNVYSAHSDQGGGVCIDLIHEWDYLVSLFGDPLNVQMFCGTYSKLEIDSEDLAVYIGAYKNMLLELHLDYFGRQTQRKLEVYCEDGTYTFDIAHAQILKDGALLESFKEAPNDKYLKEIQCFLDIYIDKIENPNDLSLAMKVLKITMKK